MVVAEQVQKPMQNQPADLVLRRVSFPPGIGPSRLGGNNNVAQEAAKLAVRNSKLENRKSKIETRNSGVRTRVMNSSGLLVSNLRFLTFDFRLSTLDFAVCLPRKRKHIRRSRLVTMRGVESRNLLVAHKAHVEGARPQLHRRAQPPDESPHGGKIDRHPALLVDDHVVARNSKFEIRKSQKNLGIRNGKRYATS